MIDGADDTVPSSDTRAFLCAVGLFLMGRFVDSSELVASALSVVDSSAILLSGNRVSIADSKLRYTPPTGSWAGITLFTIGVFVSISSDSGGVAANGNATIAFSGNTVDLRRSSLNNPIAYCVIFASPIGASGNAFISLFENRALLNTLTGGFLLSSVGCYFLSDAEISNNATLTMHGNEAIAENLASDNFLTITGLFWGVPTFSTFSEGSSTVVYGNIGKGTNISISAHTYVRGLWWSCGSSSTYVIGGDTVVNISSNSATMLNASLAMDSHTLNVAGCQVESLGGTLEIGTQFRMDANRAHVSDLHSAAASTMLTQCSPRFV